jgi:hypothetical protein
MSKKSSPQKFDRETRALIGRRVRQFSSRSEEAQRALSECLAISFRPGDRTSTFAGKLLRPHGAAVAVVLGYADNGTRPILSGLRGRLQTDGSVVYGGDSEREFQYQGGGGPSVVRNPSLVELQLQLDAACLRRADNWLLFLPRMPRIVLGFAPDQLPEYEITPALEKLAAQKIGLKPERLAANPELLVDRLLRQTWEELFVSADDPKNSTGLVLLDAEYTTDARRSLRAFEDFRGLVGVKTWNPARGVPLHPVENPTPAILARHGLEPGSGWEQAADAEQVEVLVAELRVALGDEARRYSEEDLFDALIEPTAPLAAVSQLLPRLRKRLGTYWSECTSDDDLRSAVRRPDDALFASGACRLQVLRRRATAEPFRFTAEDFGRRLELDARPIDWQSRGDWHGHTTGSATEVVSA